MLELGLLLNKIIRSNELIRSDYLTLEYACTVFSLHHLIVSSRFN